jgi:guanylate kinase
LIAKDIVGRTENQVKNRFNSMLKKIREEKTFKTSLLKTDIQEALHSVKEQIEGDTVKAEVEEQWIEELITRKMEEVSHYETSLPGRQ